MRLSEPWRRSILIITDILLSQTLEMTQEGRDIMKNRKVFFVPIEKYEDFRLKLKFLNGIELSPGLMFAISPFDNFAYAEMEEARNIISLEKIALTKKFCQLLGAKSLFVKRVKISDKKSGEDISGGIGYSNIEGKLQSKKAELRNLINRMEFKTKFTGGTSDLESAKKYLEDHRLDSDIHLKSLLEMRKGTNLVKKDEIEICLTESLQTIFELAASLKFPVNLTGISIKSSYKKIAEEKMEYYSKIEIEF